MHIINYSVFSLFIFQMRLHLKRLNNILYNQLFFFLFLDFVIFSLKHFHQLSSDLYWINKDRSYFIASGNKDVVLIFSLGANILVFVRQTLTPSSANRQLDIKIVAFVSIFVQVSYSWII